LAAGAGLPGLDGAKLKLVTRNSGPTRCTVQTTFDELIDGDRVAAVVGAYESTVTLRAIIAADRRQVPLVNTGSTVSALTNPGQRSGRRGVQTCETTEPDPRPSRWFFRVGPNDTQAARRFFALISAAQRSGMLHGVRKVAILHESHDIFGNGAAADTRKAAKNRGIEVRDYKYKTVLGTSAPLSGSSSCPPGGARPPFNHRSPSTTDPALQPRHRVRRATHAAIWPLAKARE
jgi:branched-chain amino acid transport system substrate-binding protein